jgi:ABC-type multidrug transport system permease subunit
MKNKFKDPKKYLHSYAKYSSIAIQMGVIIALGIFAGVFLDESINLNFPIFTVLLSILSVGAAIYIAIKDLLKK